ncbi:MAG TPA: amidase [Negativicutes bacterium]|nr:amidase [Negativicutes bacterium]
MLRGVFESSRIIDMDAVELSDAIRERRVSCREVMRAFLEQIDRVNPKVNAIVSLQDREGLMLQAEERDRQLAGGQWLGWMHGFPQAPKDLAATVGIPTTLGSPILKDNIPVQDAIIVERMKRSGAIVIGKTNTPEFGLGSNTYNDVFGITRNAYDQSKTAGGSSGGAAVALALRMLPVADGSDMMGSLRNPAAYNNVFGFRPSFGRVPFGPTPDVFYQQLAYEGPMARTVRDLAMLLSVQAGYDERVPLSIKEDPAMFTQPLERDFKGVRVAWLGNLGGYLAMEPGIIELCAKALKHLEDIGCIVEEVSLDYPPEKLWQTWLTMRAFLVAGRLAAYYAEPRTRALMKPEAIWEAERGAMVSTGDLFQASVNRSAWYAYLCALFQKYEYLVLPSAQVFPFAVETHWPKEVAGKPMDTYHRWMEVVIPASLAGVPAISVPVGFNGEGLPMGMQVIGKPQADLAVLQLAYSYEQAAAREIRRKPAL